MFVLVLILLFLEVLDAMILISMNRFLTRYSRRIVNVGYIRDNDMIGLRGDRSG